MDFICSGLGVGWEEFGVRVELGGEGLGFGGVVGVFLGLECGVWGDWGGRGGGGRERGGLWCWCRCECSV